MPEHLPIPGDDEQGVVDADADADHRAERESQPRHVDARAEHVDKGEADAEAHHRSQQRKSHGDHAAEGQQQDDDRGDEPEQLGGRRLLCVEETEGAADLDNQPVAGDRRDGVDQVRVGITGEVALTLVVANGHDRGGAVGRHDPRTERGTHQRDVVEAARVPQDLDDRVLVLFDTGRVVEDHLGADAGECREAVLQQVERDLGVAAGHAELASRLDVGRADGHRGPDGDDHPERHDDASVTRTETGEPFEARCHRHHLARTATRE